MPAASPSVADDTRWNAVQRRDPAADGAFVYSVASTGVYCRPSCPSRPKRRERVAFHADAAAAERAGFRACRRCAPNGPSLSERRAAAVAAACRLIDAAEETPDLDTLAAAAGMSRFHFHRVFKDATGLTPKAYGAARRADRVREALAAGGSVTEAIYEAGFNTSSRFYESAGQELGMKPSAYRGGGKGALVRFAVGECSLGSVLVAATGKGVCAILLGDTPEPLLAELQDRFPNAELVGADPGFEDTVAKVVGFIDRRDVQTLDLPLDVRGTAFQRQVWTALAKIPPGATASYADIAQAIGRPAAVRAVAQACGANALAVAIPCHRVVRADGALSGYRWGVERKRDLLARERAA
jgi:AraC family transcriptional regulator, regulatory protein of adaptative response / methylated-DNA-[protein]-cysteine methyltransferase